MSQAKHPIRNWAKYNRALINRGLPGFWMDKVAIANWYCLSKITCSFLQATALLTSEL
ncbi:hypothetical protein [Vibrio parahaemolyticus]|uniref:hypothetical protein n=1 Tax=Vibrio parahaemolyticus TaxID=670 RepID=UPI001F34C891|nr:hypothetical protein [Vibrio parahaemolyticus]MCG0008341.1 hypothetical protein [Vibrio parahaemolyticus]MDL2021116.1 hypothetical protein [Vibrio parahaemolyticus]MDL2024979.1 hypothetical protein [Vibrio parahaemolyticus]